VSAARKGILVPAIVALGGLAVLIGLGVWQLERKAWKEDLIQTVTPRLSGPPLSLPSAQQWPSLDPAQSEFQRVAFRAELPAGRTPREQEARLYTSGSALRDDVKSPGYFVFAPARLPDGRVVVVNRGYVPNPQPNAATQPAPRPEGPLEITGVLRWPEKPGWFGTDYSARDDLWFVRDPQAMAGQRGWGAVAPFYVEQESPVPTGGVPRPGRLRINLPNDHLQYALTWFALAFVLVAVFAFWARGRLRESREAL
jgi:surfeit locus 1 family protein